MKRKEMIEAIVNDQIKNGVVRPEDKQRQIDARLKGCGAAKPMSYAECERVYAEYFK